MTDKNSQQEPIRHITESDSFNRQLDATLAKLAAAEPRAGLETRILANLRTSPVPATRAARWLWPAIAVALIAVTIGLSLVWKLQTPSSSIQARTPSVAKPVATPNTETKKEMATDTQTVPAPRIKRHDSHQPAITAVRKAPKLDQFPSPRPLTENEKTLARYVARFPQEARLVAQAQAEYEIEIQKQLNESVASSASAGSD